MANDYDVIVIGGGPAGSTCATMLSRAGRSVLLLEQQVFPRFHIGESITAFGTRAFKQLGVYEELQAINYVKKRGLEFVTHEKSTQHRFPESEAHDGESPWAPQLSRAKLDHLLLRNAQASGTHVQEGKRVIRILFDGEEACGVQYRDANDHDCPSTTATSRWIIDASGQACLINQHLHDNCWDDISLDHKVAIFNHWTGDIGITNTFDDLNFKLCVHKNKADWAWFLPIEKDVVSLGIVLSPHTLKDRNMDIESFFYAHAEGLPYISEFLKKPLRTIDKFRCIKNYSYRSKHYFGKRWALVGDSAGFIDPVFSTGLQISFNSAFKLAEIVNAALSEPRPDYRLLEAYERDVNRFYRVNAMLVNLFYLADLDLPRSQNAGFIWKNLQWAGPGYRFLFWWYLGRSLMFPKKTRRRWGTEILFGNISLGNLYAELFVMLSENCERTHAARGACRTERKAFIELEV